MRRTSELSLASALLALSAALPACGVPAHAAADRARDGAFTIIALPDTQYYVARRPEIFASQTKWILLQRRALNIAVVLHEGDIVDSDTTEQWESAARALHALDGIVPYVLSTGNHDYARVPDSITRSTRLDSYFPPRLVESAFPQAGTFEPGHLENSWQVVPTSQGPWLVVSLEFGPRDAALKWADGVVKRFATLPAIVVTHAYLASDGSRYDHARRPEQPWNPYRYVRPASGGAVNDGEGIWRKLVLPNDNIRFVLCGHEIGGGTARLVSVRPDGTRVEQLLANYQTDEAGGDGYLRVMRFSPASHQVDVRTYSPYLDRYKTDPRNQFTLAY